MSEEWIVNLNVWYQCAGAEIPEKVYARIGTGIRGKVVEFAESEAHNGIATIIKRLEDENTPIDKFWYRSRVLLPDSDTETPDYIEMDRSTGKMVQYRALETHELNEFADKVYKTLIKL